MKFINALPGPVAQGLIWGIMAIGVYITYKVLDLADLTVDGTMATGGAVCIVMMQSGHSVGVSLFVAFLAGMAAGLVTGLFHTAMGIPAILENMIRSFLCAGSETCPFIRIRSLYQPFL